MFFNYAHNERWNRWGLCEPPTHSPVAVARWSEYQQNSRFFSLLEDEFSRTGNVWFLKSNAFKMIFENSKKLWVQIVAGPQVSCDVLMSREWHYTVVLPLPHAVPYVPVVPFMTSDYGFMAVFMVSRMNTDEACCLNFPSLCGLSVINNSIRRNISLNFFASCFSCKVHCS